MIVTLLLSEIIHDIVNRRQSVHDSVRVLNDIVRHLTGGLHTASRQLDSGFERVQRYEFARWTSMLGETRQFYDGNSLLKLLLQTFYNSEL